MGIWSGKSPLPDVETSYETLLDPKPAPPRAWLDYSKAEVELHQGGTTLRVPVEIIADQFDVFDLLAHGYVEGNRLADLVEAALMKSNATNKGSSVEPSAIPDEEDPSLVSYEKGPSSGG